MFDTALAAVFENQQTAARLVGIDHDSPDRITARREPWHPTDADTDADLDFAGHSELIDSGEFRQVPRSALKALLRFLLPSDSSPGKRWRLLQVRAALLCRMVDLDDIAALSLDQLGQQLGYTRAAMSFHQCRMVDALGQSKSMSGKSARAREVYRQSAIESHRRRGHVMHSDAPQHAGEEAASQ